MIKWFLINAILYLLNLDLTEYEYKILIFIK